MAQVPFAKIIADKGFRRDCERNDARRAQQLERDNARLEKMLMASEARYAAEREKRHALRRELEERRSSEHRKREAEAFSAVENRLATDA